MRIMLRAARFAFCASMLLSAPRLLFSGPDCPCGQSEEPGFPLQFMMRDIDGNPVSLSDFRGKVVLLVNVASKCGFTPQYQGLQAVYDKYKERGFVILGFPANNFKSQEPGTDEEIKSFCTLNYGVTFPLFSKVSVAGEDICPLYYFLTSAETDPGFSGPIPWNFTKFLVGRDGRVVARFDPKVTPEDRELIEAVEKALAAKQG